MVIVLRPVYFNTTVLDRSSPGFLPFIKICVQCYIFVGIIQTCLNFLTDPELILRTFLWEKNTLPKTLELINLSTILDCDVDFLLGRLQSDTHFQAYIDKTYALSPDAFQKLSILNMYQIRKENSTYREIATDWNIILDYLITTENGNLLLDQIRQYTTSCNTNISNSYCYHALLTGKEKHGRNTIKDLNSLSAILKSLDELQIYMSSLNVEKYRAKFYDLKATFLETENIPNKKAPNTSPDSP